MAISLEPQFHVRGLIAPETRFALRRWLQSFVVALNDSNETSWNTWFTEAAVFTGWHTMVASAEAWWQYVQQRRGVFSDYIIRLPELTVEPRAEGFEVRGTLEEFVGGLLVTQGQVHLYIEQSDTGFMVHSQTFLPRLLVNPERL